MVCEIVSEEIVRFLAIYAVHSNQRGRVDSVTEELEANTWSQGLSL